MKKFQKLIRDESGSSAIEYGLIAGLIVVAIIAAMTNFSATNVETYDKVNDSIANAEDVTAD